LLTTAGLSQLATPGTVRAYSRRIADGAVEALALMLGLVEEIDTAIAETARACVQRPRNV
jgi:hypothetical protein